MDHGWYVLGGASEAVGPVTTEVLIQGVRSGRVPPSARICAVGASEWTLLATHPYFAEVVREVAPPPPALHPSQQQGYGPPIQAYGQQQIQPAYGHQPMGYPSGYGGAPINIVVHNTATAGGGGLVRVGNKTRTAAAVLAIFLGGFGVHKFYLGRPILGILYLLFCWTFLPAIIGFVEGLIYLTTTEHAFDLKYNARLG